MAEVALNGTRYRAHVHDPGRLKELLFPGNRILVSEPLARGPRKTDLDLIFAWDSEGHWVLVNSALHRPISEKILSDPGLSPFPSLQKIVPEVSYGHGTRFDFLIFSQDGGRCFVEVKGCTLVDSQNVALFPDAPTKRGTRHLEELCEVRHQGLGAMLLILVFRPGARAFSPNEVCDPSFAKSFWRSIKSGVSVLAKRIGFKNDWFVYTGDIPVVKGGVQ